MSSGELIASRSASPCSRLQSQEFIDPTQVPLPPSEAGSVRENEPVNIPESASIRPTADEIWKDIQTKNFLQEVAEHDPYIPNPDPMPTELVEDVDEGKKPTRTESWERMLKEASRHDEDMVKGWRDDIDTLLVFAGLFSAVVTAFAIESYQWLDEDPTDTTVTLLTQLVSVQVNGSQATSFERTPFKPDASSIRINFFWFLSLILSLASALFGLLCKQWVREHQRDTTTRTPGEALALRQLRRDSFEKWGVSSFLSALPILLEVALLLFFVGVLDLLWNRHPVPFAICFVAVSVSAGLYFLTALLPTLMVPRDQKDDIFDGYFDRVSYQFICPYKSPQAWLVYRLSSASIRPLLRIPAINNFLREKARHFWDHIQTPALDWSSLDLWVVRQLDYHVTLKPYGLDHLNLKVYELRAFEWAVAMFRDSPSMIPHLRNLLGTISPSVAVSAVLGRWDRTMWKVVSTDDVEDLRFPDPFPWYPRCPNPTIRHPILQQPEGISLLFHHQYWARLAANADRSLGYYAFNTLIGSIKGADLQHSIGLRFVIPFSVAGTLWTHQDPTIRVKSLALLPFFKESWKSCPGYDEERHNEERQAFMRALADHINRHGRVTPLLTTKRGQAFISYINNEAITRRLVYRIPTWPQAIEKAKEVGGLPANYFAPIHGSPDDLPTLPNLDPIRCSIDTERDNDGVLNIITSNGTEDTSGVGHNHVNDNTILGSRFAESPDEMSDIASRELGEGHEDNLQNLGRGDSTKDLGPRRRTDTGILDNSSGQGDEAGDSYRLRRERSRVDAIAQPTHDQKHFDEDNVQRAGIDTGTFDDPIEQDDEVRVHSDSYGLYNQNDQEHAEP